ncbi:MAG: autotransporter outer membrane beta-barrel domain-containing protein [Methylovirgula sp.]|uniref:autotransporter outer membrane beta-barrel domain-containing protein n=1 Tax=Methylovirgula sp. TaxID=1978224 RepID=UPI0030760E6A
MASHDVNAAAYGSAAGVDYHVNPDTVVGLSLAGAGLQWNLSSGLGNGQGDAIQAGVYGATRFNRFYVAGAFGFANHWINTNREALGDSLTANFGAQSYGGRIEGGYRLPFAMPIPLPIFQAPIAIVPYAAVQPQVFHTPAYSENDIGGAGFGLNYNSADATDVRTEVGFRADTVTYLGAGPSATKIDLFTRTAWAHDFTNTPSLDAVFQTLPGANFTVYGARTPHNSALVSDGAQLWLTSSLSIIAKFDGELAGDANIYAGTGTLRYTW